MLPCVLPSPFLTPLKSQMGMSLLLVSILLLLMSSSLCESNDQLAPAKPLSPGDTLISQGGAFALGFFSPSSNSNQSLYLGIWYNNIPERTVVWVANRDSPITEPSSAVVLAFADNNQELVLSDSKGRVLWKTTTTLVNNITDSGSAVAVLLNSGNFVLQSSSNGAAIWQSFDHPTDTILPTMRFVLAATTSNDNRVGRLVAWKGPEDPSRGDFSFSVDPRSDLQLFIWRGASPYCRTTVLNSGYFVSGMTYQSSTASSFLSQAFISAEGEFYYMYTDVSDDGSVYTRITLGYNGKLRLLVWNNVTLSWTVLNEDPSSCNLYASCGPFSYCDFTATDPTCRCLDGFEPIIDAVNFSRGCRRKEEMVCGKENNSIFFTFPGMKVPDKFLHIRNTSFDQCATECSTNCSCSAYAYDNMSTAGAMGDTSRCWLWTGDDLVDMSKFNRFGENLYLRLARSPVRKKNLLAKVLPPIAVCLLLLTITGIVWTCKYTGKQKKKKAQKRIMVEYLRPTDEGKDNNIEFPFIKFEDIAAATNNFSHLNMLGKGGFGKVYKGVLEGTKEVAIKKLSKGSGQGDEEFRNEVVLIAKLQHKNLVNLLGCCIHEDEKLLVYEYLPNKSLDYFLFDSTRKSMLQWPTRFKIIQGIARGIMYLHQDSRLTIIHRDLKASNILLDNEMSPKISDFGMARIFYGNQHQAHTNRVAGTYGYMSPEYAMEGAFSVKSDTYSFGILLLEIVSGLKISSPHLIVDFPNLIAYAWNVWKDGKIEDLVDPAVKENCHIDEVSRCIHIGLLCVQDSVNSRPLLSAVVVMLENKTAPLPLPIQPVYFARRDAEPRKVNGNGVSSVNDMSLTVPEGR